MLTPSWFSNQPDQQQTKGQSAIEQIDVNPALVKKRTDEKGRPGHGAEGGIQQTIKDNIGGVISKTGQGGEKTNGSSFGDITP